MTEALRSNPVDDLGLSELLDAVNSLEIALNPNRIAWGDPRRLAIGVVGWPLAVGRALSRTRRTQDRVLTTLKWTAMCEGKGQIVQIEPYDAPAPENLAALRNVRSGYVYWNQGDRESAIASVEGLIGDFEREANTLAKHLRIEMGRDRQARIPPDERTRPMSFRRAAKLMGKGTSRDAAEWLSASVRDGTIRCEHVSRQTHIFSKYDFPKSAWPQILPESPATGPN